MSVGILGGGQLARMIALAGHPLGLHFTFLDPAADACGTAVGTLLQGGYDDPTLLAQLAARSEVVTFEFENVPAASAERLAAGGQVYPPPQALAVAQNRLREKGLFRELGIPTPPFAAVNSLADLEAAVAEIGLPGVLKTCSEGYDGKGQVVLRDPTELAAGWAAMQGAAAILEGFIDFDREISIIAARGRNGEVVFYPVSENSHREGILRLSLSTLDDPMQAEAEACAHKLLDALDYVGVMTMELFQAGDQLLANEIAPRVHNSGHWTIEGAETSQFENHLRAILGLPLGATDAIGYSAMVNFIGTIPSAAEVLAIPGAHYHAYDKAPRPGRKVGHATLRADDQETLLARLPYLQALA